MVKYLEGLEGNPPGNLLDYPTKDKTHMEFTEDNGSNSDTIEPSEQKRNNIELNKWLSYIYIYIINWYLKTFWYI